ncbi:glycerol dehydratase reactivase beta/small subunit family protein [Pseudaeromonas sp. ZJS20]|uniref:glycerol dehydratase reactivase beta/small subunit family protein n=1 Tax=Pseudaeromonas aegiceratis TaxID=3153928 RepID=UPI00390CB830
MRDLTMNAPEILIHLLGQCDSTRWQQVYYGIEEEGIPYRIVQVTGSDPVQAAHLAAQQSPLQVGLGGDERQLAVHYKTLQPEQPMFRLTSQAQQSSQSLRCLGANAARLVKGLPFKPIN